MEHYTLPGQFEYEGIILTDKLFSAKMIDGSRRLTLNSNDVIVATYPRSGTTWMKYLVHLVLNNGQVTSSQLAKEGAHYFERRYPGEDEEETLKKFAETPSPRLFPTHLPAHIIEKHVLIDKARTIVVMRNPKDTLVSLFNFYQMNKVLGPFPGTWDEFFQLFKLKRIIHGDFFDHNIGWWKMSEAENVLVVFYEEMKDDLAGVVRNVAKFTGHNLSDDVIQKIVHLTSFKQMQDNPTVNLQAVANMGLLDFNKSKFIRKGEVGGWKDYFSEDQSKYIDHLCEEKLAPIGLTFQCQ